MARAVGSDGSATDRAAAYVDRAAPWRRVLRIVQRLGDHDGDRLTVKVHLVVLQHVQALADGRIDRPLVRAIGKARVHSGG